MLRGVLSFLLVHQATSLIYKYDDILLDNLVLKYRTDFMFASIDEGQSFIKADLSFALKKSEVEPEFPVILQATILKVDDLDMDLSALLSTEAQGPDSLAFACCTPNDLGLEDDEQICMEENTIASRLVLDDKYHVQTRYYQLDDELENLDFIYFVQSTGTYAMLVSYCNKAPSQLVINGHVIWQNYFGLLSAAQYPLLDFYLKLSFVYIGTFLIWIYMLKTSKFENNNLTLYLLVTILVLFSMFEMNLRYFNLHELNTTGQQNGSLEFFTFIFLSFKRAITRLMLIWIASGMILALKRSDFIVRLTLLYFVVAFFQLYFSSNGNEVILLDVVLAGMDTYYYLRTFEELGNVIRENKPGVEKFKTLKMLLIGEVVIVVLFVFFSFAVKLELHEGLIIGVERVWLLDAFWEVMYYIVLLVVMYLWRPLNNVDSSYSRIKHEVPEDDEEFGLIRD